MGYKDGTEFVGWHCDDEPLLDAVKHDAGILSLSLGASRWFELCSYDDPESVTRVQLEDGDLCVTEGRCQKHFRHRIPQELEVTSPRINLTWRWVVRHEEHCCLYTGEHSDSTSEGG